MRTDSGPNEIDAATGNIDAGIPLDVSTPRDTNMPDSEAAPDTGPDAEEGCGGPPPLSLSSSQLPRCSAATSACVEGCSTGACQNTCLEADDTEPVNVDGRIVDCLDCLNIENTACAVSEGCQAEWDAFRCCEADCPNLACAGACQSTHRSALRTCYQMFAVSCQSALMRCFAE